MNCSPENRILYFPFTLGIIGVSIFAIYCIGLLVINVFGNFTWIENGRAAIFIVGGILTLLGAGVISFLVIVGMAFVTWVRSMKDRSNESLLLATV